MTTHSHRSVAVLSYRISDQASGQQEAIMQNFLSGLDQLK